MVVYLLRSANGDELMSFSKMHETERRKQQVRSKNVSKRQKNMKAVLLNSRRCSSSCSADHLTSSIQVYPHMSFPVQEDGILVETTSSTISFSNTSKLLFMIPIWIASIGESPLLVAFTAETNPLRSRDFVEISP